ncbi:hypothetical protein BVG16_22955 [Paenibacillus selenitireducens]|uniref:LysM domain-containing protein n=1 Tax=Paenibacillus selenitireducens TaxID=1324314 RepID=A0A1T2X3Z9_9BACL|nr:3D domain-containing protein [Paenibacillus selenitireducens]OPA74624.1 hypothetical protein BVG16_22955 [Paenibacillus selenitireducens]
MKFNLLQKLSVTFVAGFLAIQTAPAFAAAPYYAKDGDTFYKIAQQANMDVNTLMNANPTVNPLNIYQGLQIEMPEKTVKAASADTKMIETPVKTQDAAEAPAKSQAAQKAPAKKAAVTTNSVNADEKIINVAGNELNYKKAINVKATAYTAAASENGAWAGLDYFGNALSHGTIAVDPKMIPLGTKVFVTGYDFNGLPTGGFVGTAKDIGGSIKGNRIDIFVGTSQSNASKFGIQNVKVFILE